MDHHRTPYFQGYTFPPEHFLQPCLCCRPPRSRGILPTSSALYPRQHFLVIQFIKKIKAEKGYEKIGAVGLVMQIAIRKLTNSWLTRYCFGGAMAVRLGSTDLVNTIVVAHPASVSPAQMRAVKVNMIPSVLSQVSLISLNLGSYFLGASPR
jgi:hypothetical protein